jgi:dephospho-CoA kinase
MAHTTIGIAGFMGSGKSTCAKILGRRGWLVIDADLVAKDLMHGDERIRQQIVDRFGADVCVGESISFALLGSRAFSSTPALDSLNRIVHPPLLKRLENEIRNAAGICIVDAALLPLWSIQSSFSDLVWIAAPRDVRLERLVERTSLSRAIIETRMRIQEEFFMQPVAASWSILDNAGDLAAFEALVASRRWPSSPESRVAC